MTAKTPTGTGKKSPRLTDTTSRYVASGISIAMSEKLIVVRRRNQPTQEYDTGHFDSGGLARLV